MRATTAEALNRLVVREGLELDPSRTVIVSTGKGTRFHLPSALFFETACNTTFDEDIREISATQALEEDFTPCMKHHCFGRPPE